ncbi:hypothetical protein D3C87_1827640 [compost metagenome]
MPAAQLAESPHFYQAHCPQTTWDVETPKPTQIPRAIVARNEKATPSWSNQNEEETEQSTGLDGPLNVEENLSIL